MDSSNSSNKPSQLFQKIRAQLSAGRTESSVYRSIPLPPIPRAIVNGGSPVPIPTVSVQWSPPSTRAIEIGTEEGEEEEEEYARDTSVGARIRRTMARVMSRHAVHIVPLFFTTLGCAVLIAYLVWGTDTKQQCGAECNELGGSGLYLSAFGSCTALNATADVDTAWCSYGGTNGSLTNGTSVVAVVAAATAAAALSIHQFGHYDPPAASPVCGKCVLVSGPYGKVRARVVAACTGCASGDIQLSWPAFRVVSAPGQAASSNSSGATLGGVPVSWGPC
ncbi:hypothetical protein GGI11_000004 [Coemansia sp. RSA 2049]|nr:hypothetical protein H4217_007570 [Coemansia sp. RSA 1939]KAJ2525432.1 hypothetical protein GGI11_000004 [Coemansia sp. RSA 2049]KAJ2608794.1 hypothetical protein EV177_004787 [Coemansia sp. RSA 1804]